MAAACWYGLRETAKSRASTVSMASLSGRMSGEWGAPAIPVFRHLGRQCSIAEARAGLVEKSAGQCADLVHVGGREVPARDIAATEHGREQRLGHQKGEGLVRLGQRAKWWHVLVRDREYARAEGSFEEPFALLVGQGQLERPGDEGDVGIRTTAAQLVNGFL